jgi:predicted RNA-binding protein YlxR (DUF448 family)
MEIETVQHKGYTIQIHTDDCAESPRTAWDNLGTIVFAHRRYDFNELKQMPSGEPLRWENFKSLDDLRTRLDHLLGGIIALPLYMLDHSGLRFSSSSSSFSACDPQGWDWGRGGFIFVSKAKVRKEYGWKVITKERQAKIEEYLRGEVETLDQYVSGAVYGYKILNPDGEEMDDSCWGFYGYDHEKSGLLEQARGSIEASIAHEEKNGVQQVLELEPA